MKVIAYYLPQFHEIPENNKWWGEGFTEWTNVKKAIPLKEGQNQPRIPLKNNYYDLSDVNVMRWQAELARKYGIYGFCIYHYWFNGKLLLQKPVENLLKNVDIGVNYCFCWANENWTNQWVSGTSQKMLIEQTYGDENEWRQHFEYFLPFFQDDRYIKVGNKPLLVIYRPDLIENLDVMLEKWNEWAQEYGFESICYAYQKCDSNIFNYKNGRDKSFTYQIEYQPSKAMEWQRSKAERFAIKCKRKLFREFNNLFSTHRFSTYAYEKKLHALDYDKAWNSIISHAPESPKCVPGAFVDWDNTPRKQTRGVFYEGVSLEKFEYYFDKLIRHARNVYKKDMIFIFAWNEWAEGGYLEPDEKNRYGYLEAIKKALEENGEFPSC